MSGVEELEAGVRAGAVAPLRRRAALQAMVARAGVAVIAQRLAEAMAAAADGLGDGCGDD